MNLVLKEETTARQANRGNSVNISIAEKEAPSSYVSYKQDAARRDFRRVGICVAVTKRSKLTIHGALDAPSSGKSPTPAAKRRKNAAHGASRG